MIPFFQLNLLNPILGSLCRIFDMYDEIFRSSGYDRWAHVRASEYYGMANCRELPLTIHQHYTFYKVDRV